MQPTCEAAGRLLGLEDQVAAVDILQRISRGRPAATGRQWAMGLSSRGPGWQAQRPSAGSSLERVLRLLCLHAWQAWRRHKATHPIRGLICVRRGQWQGQQHGERWDSSAAIKMRGRLPIPSMHATSLPHPPTHACAPGAGQRRRVVPAHAVAGGAPAGAGGGGATPGGAAGRRGRNPAAPRGGPVASDA